jgi:hypothetical protein
MPLRITEDLVLGASYTFTKSGPSLLRIFDVAGLTPGKQTLAQAAVAVDSVANTRIPRYGEPHPAVPGLYAIEIGAVPLNGSRTVARVTVHYGTPAQATVPGAARIRIGGANGHKLMAQMPDGSLAVVKYTDADGNTLADHLQIPVLSPNTVLEITRMETRSPLTMSEKFRRTVNASPWQGGDAKSWLCRGIDGASQGSLSQYEVRYQFEYDPDGWERLEYFVDRYTGKVPDDVKVSSSNDHGVAKILPYATREFAELGLPNAY